MSEITVRGYVNKPNTKSGTKGQFSVFTLAEKQKNRGDEPPTKNYFNVTNFNAPEPPEESAYVEVKGYLKFRKYNKDGVERVSFDVVANEVTAVGSDGGARRAAPAAPAEKEPWDE